MDRIKAHKKTVKLIGNLPCLECKTTGYCNDRNYCNRLKNYLDLYNEIMLTKALQSPKIIKTIMKVFGIKPEKYKPINTIVDFIKLEYDTN